MLLEQKLLSFYELRFVLTLFVWLCLCVIEIPSFESDVSKLRKRGIVVGSTVLFTVGLSHLEILCTLLKWTTWTWGGELGDWLTCCSLNKYRCNHRLPSPRQWPKCCRDPPSKFHTHTHTHTTHKTHTATLRSWGFSNFMSPFERGTALSLLNW